MNRSSAFSRIEQVLNRIRSACSRGGDLAVPERLQHAPHPLRVVLVHLAAERRGGGTAWPSHPGYRRRSSSRLGIPARRARCGPRPSPSGSAARTRPPWASAIARTIASPRPAPPPAARLRAHLDPVEALEDPLALGAAGSPARRRSTVNRSRPGRDRRSTSSRTSPSGSPVCSIAFRPRLRTRLREPVGVSLQRPLGDLPELEAPLRGQAEPIPQPVDERLSRRSTRAAGSRPVLPASGATGRRPSGSRA